MRQIFDSRGFPTVEAEVELYRGGKGRASAPSGASTGKYEALERRDGDSSRYLGKGVEQTIKFAQENSIDLLKEIDFEGQQDFDAMLLSVLGSNVTLALSLAFARACAGEVPLYEFLGQMMNVQKFQVPKLMINIINGGAHADNALDIQEFMIIPALDFPESLRAGSEIFHTLKGLLKAKGLSTNVGDEGGFAPDLTSSRQALDLIMEAIYKAGYSRNVRLGLDVAASELFDNGHYTLERKAHTSEDLLTYYQNLLKNYPIISIEDGFDEDDWTGWAMAKEACPHTMWVGDDLFVTQKERLKEGIKKEAANAILIKLNQVGNLSDTISTLECAKTFDYRTVISHRSGETEDTFIADFAIASRADYIKAGSLSRTDRTCKYNQLLRCLERIS